MSLGGVRGFAMTFSPLARGSYLVTEVGWAPLNRRAVTASATRSGTAALVGGQLTARTSLGRGQHPYDSGSVRPERFEISIIHTNAINNVVTGDNSPSDNLFFPDKHLSPDQNRKLWLILGRCADPSIMLGRTLLILEKPCSATDQGQRRKPISV
jgi:hypothetical protein